MGISGWRGETGAKEWGNPLPTVEWPQQMWREPRGLGRGTGSQLVETRSGELFAHSWGSSDFGAPDTWLMSVVRSYLTFT